MTNEFILPNELKEHICQRWGEIFYRMSTELQAVRKRDFVCMHIVTYIDKFKTYLTGAITVTKHASDTFYGIFSADPIGVHVSVGYPHLGVYYFNREHMIREGRKSYKFDNETSFQCGALDTVNEPVYVQVDWNTGTILRMDTLENLTP